MPSGEKYDDKSSFCKVELSLNMFIPAASERQGTVMSSRPYQSFNIYPIFYISYTARIGNFEFSVHYGVRCL